MFLPQCGCLWLEILVQIAIVLTLHNKTGKHLMKQISVQRFYQSPTHRESRTAKMYFNRKINKLIGFLVLFLLSANFAYFYFDSSRFIERFKPKSNIGAQTYSLQNEKICWEDWDFINYERSRMGPGEHGEPWNVTDPEELKKNLESVAKEGFFVDANQKMSLTRSLPDHRPKMCAPQSQINHESKKNDFYYLLDATTENISNICRTYPSSSRFTTRFEVPC